MNVNQRSKGKGVGKPVETVETVDSVHGSVEKPAPEYDHELKTQPCYFTDVATGRKTFEIRNAMDRDFQVGQVLLLREYATSVSGIPGMYTGREAKVQVTYVLDFPDGLKDGYVALGIRLMHVRLNVGRDHRG